MDDSEKPSGGKLPDEKKVRDLARTQDREDIYVAEYVANGGNGTAAMMKAAPNLDAKGAGTASARMMSKVGVREKIEKSLRAQIKRIDARGDRVITELFRILSADIKDAFDESTGALLPVHKIPEELRRAIAGFEVEEIWEYPDGDRDQPKIVVGELKKVKFWSKTESANLLGKHLKLWLENAGVDVGISFTDGDVEMTLAIKT